MAQANAIIKSMNTTKGLGRHGFTIVELLIVVIVIAILAAITIVAYNGIQNRAKASAAQASAKQAFTKIQTYATTNAEQYPSSIAAAGLSSTGDTTYRYSFDNITRPKSFCVTATTNTVSYYVSNLTSSPVEGMCTGHDAPQGASITNFVQNPNANTSTTGWVARTNATITATPTSPIDGANSILLTATNVGASVIAAPYGTTFLPVSVGQPYVGSMYVKPLDVAGVFRLVIDWYNGTTYVDAFQGQPQTVNVGETARLSALATAPANASRAQIYTIVGGTGGVAGNRWLVDNAMFYQGTALYGYADGDSPGWAWNGTVNSSSSTGLSF